MLATEAGIRPTEDDMTKQQFFNAIRNYINKNTAEPHPGFIANNLSLTVGEFDLAIEGRGSRGIGYVTVRMNIADGGLRLIASESAVGGTFNAGAAVECLLAVVEHAARADARAALTGGQA